MSLKEKLDEIKAGFSAQVSDEVKEIMGRNTQALIDSGLTQKVIKVGELFPPFALKDSTGKLRTIQEVSADKPVVISFFRGFW